MQQLYRAMCRNGEMSIMVKSIDNVSEARGGESRRKVGIRDLARIAAVDIGRRMHVNVERFPSSSDGRRLPAIIQENRRRGWR